MKTLVSYGEDILAEYKKLYQKEKGEEFTYGHGEAIDGLNVYQNKEEDYFTITYFETEYSVSIDFHKSIEKINAMHKSSIKESDGVLKSLNVRLFLDALLMHLKSGRINHIYKDDFLSNVEVRVETEEIVKEVINPVNGENAVKAEMFDRLMSRNNLSFNN